MSRKYKIGTTIGALQLTEYIGTNEATNNHIYTARCRQCGNTQNVDSYTLQLGTMKACTKCSPTETRREISAKEQLRIDQAAEAAAQKAKVDEQTRLNAIAGRAAYEARLTVEFGQEYVDQLNARRAQQ